MPINSNFNPLADGTVYSRRKDFCPFSAAALDDYTPILGEERLDRLRRAADRVKGLKVLEINATHNGGAWRRCYTGPFPS